MSNDRQPQNSEAAAEAESAAPLEEIDSAVQKLGDSLSTADGQAIEESLQQLLETARDTSTDLDEALNTMRLPDDAGQYEDGLRKILQRIPNGWGRWISTGPGWYPLLVDLDDKLSELFPNYEVQQVKEKFGGLRYYWEPPYGTPYSLIDSMPDDADAFSDWLKRKELWEASNAGKDIITAFQRRREQANQLVRATETQAEKICEECGESGLLTKRGGWYKTLCPADIARLGYEALAPEQ